ncbi:glutaminyl-peptide cyclotransferase [Spongiimicrobium salis]|uniref:glutaminyl-peptide cyclotransferase n=1 Tax=Spongiimicrobium salis TaxID=1667022 RepID=UPI00374D0702
MNIVKYLFVSLLALAFSSCGNGNIPPTQLFEIQMEGKQNKFQQQQVVPVKIRNKKEKNITGVRYFIDGQELPLADGKLTLDITRLGTKTLIAKIAYDNTEVEISKKIRVLSSKPYELYTYEVINEFPHDIEAFTQGLEFYKDTLYESTGSGNEGITSLRKVNYKTGEVLKKVLPGNNFFGEGITILNDKIFMLTWQHKIGFIYDVNSLEKIDNFNYGESKEGWGFCNDGKVLFKSDGSERIWTLNPDTLIEEGYIETVTNTAIFNKTNELEYVDGKIYANVWQKESMMIIDATSGAIEGVVNFGGLKKKVTKHDKLDVLNGVAYHPERKTFFVTGKNWDKLFEVKITKKQ